MRKLLIRILLATNLIGWLFLGIFQHKFLGELVVSFLPQLLVLSFISIFIVFLLLINTKDKIKPAFAIIISISFLLLNSFHLLSFYDLNTVSGANSNKSSLKVLSSNLFYQNYNFEDIKNLVDNRDPDILIFVEYSKEHHEALKSHLESSYPFSTIGESSFGQDVIYSKYEIKSQEYFENRDILSGFVKAEIDVDGEIYSIYAVHTTAPLTNSWFRRRNDQLKLLASTINRDTNSNFIIAGDFNLTPWSKFYREFEKEIDNKVVNITKKNGVNFTWNAGIPLVSNHIDHAFVSNNQIVNNFKTHSVTGSDHKALYFEILQSEKE